MTGECEGYGARDSKVQAGGAATLRVRLTAVNSIMAGEHGKGAPQGPCGVRGVRRDSAARCD
jgi:hypothetical protein